MASSIQTQHNTKSSRVQLVHNLMRMIDDVGVELSPYGADSRRRDGDLLVFSRSEPLLSSVLSSVVQRDINRSWMLTGALSKVQRTAKNLHSVNNGRGWRDFISKLSTSYYSTNVGFAAEVGTDKIKRPVTMWSFDPTTLVLTDDVKYGMYYLPSKMGGKRTKLKMGDYLHGNSMPSVEENLRGVGFCAIERALMMVRITIGLFQHHLEKLGVAPPKGLALFKGMEKRDYDQAMAEAEEEMTNEEIVFFRNVIALFTSNTDSDVDLIGFSELPDSFDLREFVDIIMQTYALAFGYPVSEVWTISSGSFSRDGEMKVQQGQATEKGELAFSLSLQEQIKSYFIPSSVDFSFDFRNDEGDLVKAEIAETKIKAYTQLYNAGRTFQGEGEPLVTRQQLLELLANEGIIPNEWLDNEEDAVTKDIKHVREQVRRNPYIVNRALNFPDEPIVCYRWNQMDSELGGVFVENDSKDYLLSREISKSPCPSGVYHMLYPSGEEMLRKRIY